MQRRPRRRDEGSATSEDDELTVPFAQELPASGADDNRVLYVKSAESDLVIGSLDVENHVLLKDCVLAGREKRRLVDIHADGVAHMMAAIVRDSGIPRRLNTNVEDLGRAAPGPRRVDHRVFCGLESCVVA